MKKALAVILALAMTVSLVACGEAPAKTSAAPEVKTTEAAPQTTKAEAQTTEKAAAFEEGQQFPVMEFVTGPANGGWSQIGAAIADKANTYFNGFPITATTGGGVSNPSVMGKGEATIGLNQAIMLIAAANSTTPFEGQDPVTNIRSICSLDSSLVYFVVDASVKANTVGELVASGEKIKIGTLTAGNASTMLTEMVLAEYGSSMEALCDGDVYVTDSNGLTDAYSDHHVDFVVRNVALPNAALTELMTARESKILGIEEDVCKKLFEKYDFPLVTIPANTYPGQTEDVLTVAVKTVLSVTDDCPDAVAYFLAKTMYEYKEYFGTVQAAYNNLTYEDMVQNLTVDIHPGAEAFWKEMGYIK